MRSRMPLNSQKGFSLITILVGLGVVSIVALGVITWNLQKKKLSLIMNTQAVAEQITQKLKGAIISPESWAKTFSSSPVTGTGYGNGNGNGTGNGYANGGGNSNPPLDIYIVDGANPSSATTPYYRSGDSNAGFDMHGNPCQTFDGQNGNDSCPFHYDITLASHTFQNGNWIDKVHFALTYKPKSVNGVVLNTSAASGKYNFDFTRNWDDQSVEKSCIAVNGTYDIPSGKCTVKLTNPVNCTPTAGGAAYKTPNGGVNTANCETPRAPATSCGPNMAITGFTSQGSPICVHL